MKLINVKTGDQYKLLEQRGDVSLVQDEITNETSEVSSHDLEEMPPCTCTSGDGWKQCALHGIDGLFKKISAQRDD